MYPKAAPDLVYLVYTPYYSTSALCRHNPNPRRLPQAQHTNVQIVGKPYALKYVQAMQTEIVGARLRNVSVLVATGSLALTSGGYPLHPSLLIHRYHPCRYLCHRHHRPFCQHHYPYHRHSHRSRAAAHLDVSL